MSTEQTINRAKENYGYKNAKYVDFRFSDIWRKNLNKFLKMLEPHSHSFDIVFEVN